MTDFVERVASYVFETWDNKMSVHTRDVLMIRLTVYYVLDGALVALIAFGDARDIYFLLKHILCSIL